MKKAKYYEIPVSDYATLNEGQGIFRLSRKKLLEEAEKCGALITIGDRIKRIDIEKMKQALIENYAGGQD